MKTAALFLLLGCVSCEAFEIVSLMDKITQLETKLQNTEKEVAELRRLTQGSPKAVFSASLYDSGSGNIGPFNTATTLIYRKVYANVGSGYNPSTGIFTAQTKGLYFFHFTMFNNRQTVPNSVLILRKNEEQVASLWDVSGSDPDSGSNAVVLPLEVGDSVRVELPPNREVYDDSAHFNTFTGFLLLPL